ncbi:right-handed parallel beta-helix repeat-containing protein [Yinghuangia seranimata]|uniref:right-handed parallel beta-helix repeat-containing protein n=1 Tax=Yinghuangia seranimata TaxID=408067 RepID=UPI00248BF40E|nr:right-handed parallel beta-helix repeat-containing protein [Yinghuangia seranimata]MDI2128987.1 right-handed parallel beta-helix repeat-containing protein [Yinghuangia seranimata]
MPHRRFRPSAGVLALALVGSGVLIPASAHARGVVHRVLPGESVQAAVDAAAPGDVVELAAGTYPGGVLIGTDRLTLRGPSSGEAVIVPAGASPSPSGRSASAPAPGVNEIAPPCSEGGYGVCVLGTPTRDLVGVRVASLTVTGFAKSGVMGRYTDGMTVTGVRSRGNGEHGIGQEFSVRGSFTGNVADDNAQSGLFVGDAPDARGTAVRGNHAEGNRIGVHVRRGRNIGITGNETTGNCAGMFVVGDETHPVTGDVEITGNTMVANNRYCPANARIAHIQGSGIVLTGAQHVRIAGNQILDNQGDSPMSGGVVMVPSFTGDGTSEQTLVGNTILRNASADVAERDPRGVGSNTYTSNVCGTTQPADLC